MNLIKGYNRALNSEVYACPLYGHSTNICFPRALTLFNNYIATAAFVVAQELLLIETVIRPAYNSTFCYFLVLNVI